MPSPAIQMYKPNKIANNHSITTGIPTQAPYTQLPKAEYQYQAQLKAMQVLNGYNPYGNGNCPGFDFIIPGGFAMGNKLTFSYGSADIQYNSNSWSTLSGTDKKIVYFWLANFVREGMIAYDKYYGI